MKRILFLSSALLILVNINAQDSYIGINLGMSIPGENFSGEEELFSQGYAVSGFSIEFDGIYFPGSIFGIGGMLGFGSYYSQQDSYFNNVMEYLDSHPDNPFLDLPGKEDITFESGFWNIVSIMAGPELAVPFWRFQLGVRAMGGTSIIISPKKELSFENTNSSIFVKSGGTNLSLSYMYGASLMYYLSPGTSLRLAADYYNGNSKYDFEAGMETPLGTMDEEVENSVKINTLQLSLGLSYAF